MPLIKSGEQSLLDAINASASVALTRPDVMFSQLVVIPNPVDGKNTQVKVQMKQTAAARGAVNVTYHRVDFSEVFTGPTGNNPLKVVVTPSFNTSLDCVASMRQFSGIDISAEDLVSHDIDLNAKTVLIEAAPNSIGWTGSVVALTVPGDAVISNAFPPAALPPLFAYPSFNTNLGQAAIYSYRYDFTDYAATLRPVTADTLNLTSIAAMLKAVTTQDWLVGRNPTDYNLNGAVFVYNGLNTNPKYPGNPNYNRVLVLNLAFYSLKLGGLLYIHYNA